MPLLRDLLTSEQIEEAVQGSRYDGCSNQVGCDCDSDDSIEGEVDEAQVCEEHELHTVDPQSLCQPSSKLI